MHKCQSVCLCVYTHVQSLWNWWTSEDLNNSWALNMQPSPLRIPNFSLFPISKPSTLAWVLSSLLITFLQPSLFSCYHSSTSFPSLFPFSALPLAPGLLRSSYTGQARRHLQDECMSVATGLQCHGYMIHTLKHILCLAHCWLASTHRANVWVIILNLNHIKSHKHI